MIASIAAAVSIPIATSMFARHSGGTGTTPEEEDEARKRPDISVFPLATPLIAGPGAISATILLTTPSGVFSLPWLEVVAALIAILLLCYLAMLVAIPVQRILGLTGLAVVSRVVEPKRANSIDLSPFINLAAKPGGSACTGSAESERWATPGKDRR